jgi:hypothetical protein
VKAPGHTGQVLVCLGGRRGLGEILAGGESERPPVAHGSSSLAPSCTWLSAPLSQTEDTLKSFCTETFLHEKSLRGKGSLVLCGLLCISSGKWYPLCSEEVVLGPRGLC